MVCLYAVEMGRKAKTYDSRYLGMFHAWRRWTSTIIHPCPRCFSILFIWSLAAPWGDWRSHPCTVALWRGLAFLVAGSGVTPCIQILQDWVAQGAAPWKPTSLAGEFWGCLKFGAPQWIKTSCSHLIGYLSGSPPLSDKPMSKGYVFPSNVLFQTDDATFLSQRQYLMLTTRMTRMTTMLMMSRHMKAQHEQIQYQSTCSWRGVALLSAWKFRATQIWDDSN